PGDMGNATTRIGNCGSVTACTDSATSNGRLNVNVGAAASGEGINFFGQLVAADLIGGMDGSSVAPQLGVSNPTAPIGGGFLAGDNRTGDSTGALASALRPSPYITLTSDLNTVGGVGTVTDLQAATIDRRIDDGNPNAGMLISNNTATECVAAANAQTYSAANSLCVISYRMQ
nr:hypothetical protein [Micavibrio sp.]